MAYLDNFHSSIGATTEIKRAISTLFFISVLEEDFIPYLGIALCNAMPEDYDEYEIELWKCRSDIEEFIKKDESEDVKLFIDYVYKSLGVESYDVINNSVLGIKHDEAISNVYEHLKNNKFPNEIVYGDNGEKYDITDKIWQDAIRFCIKNDGDMEDMTRCSNVLY